MLERVGSQVLLVAMWISNVAARALVMSDILEPSVFCEWKNRPHHCFYHIACKTRHTEQCADVLPLPVHVAELIVDLHNHCRDHAISKRPHDPPEFFITYPRLGHLPPSAGLMQLFWDEELADMASQWVGTCTIQSKAARSTEKTFKPPPPPREHNVYESYNLTRNKSIEYEKEFCFDVSRFPVKGWLWISKEHHEVKMDDQWRTLLWEFCSDVSRNLPQYIIESYRPPQESLGAYFREEGVSMLWGKTVRVGCGHRLPKEDESYGVRFSALACLYGPAPLQLGARVYEVGKSGSACPPQAPAGSAYFPNLCVPQKSKWEIAVIIVPVVVALCLAAACLAYAPQF